MLSNIRKDFKNRLNYYNRNTFIQLTYKHDRHKIDTYIPSLAHSQAHTINPQTLSTHTHPSSGQQPLQPEGDSPTTYQHSSDLSPYPPTQQNITKQIEQNAHRHNPEDPSEDISNIHNQKEVGISNKDQLEFSDTDYSHLKPLGGSDKKAPGSNRPKSTSECWRRHPNLRMMGKSSINMHRYIKRFHDYGAPKSPQKQIIFSTLCKIPEAQESEFDFY